MRIRTIVTSLAAVLAISLFFPAHALAHETRRVGPYQFVVGWLAEPAFQGQSNAASMRISDTRVTPARPVEGLEKTLAIEVRAGGLTPYTGTIRAVFGQPGLYALDLIPTVSGAYTFRIAGKVEDLDVNERFESGPGRFDEVRDQTPLQYPAKVPVGDDLAARLDALAADIALVKVLAIAALALAVILPVGGMLLRRRSGA